MAKFDLKTVTDKIKACGPKKLIGNVVTALLGVLLVGVFVAFIAVLVQIGQGKAPSLFGYRFYYVLTDSMTPTYAVGDVVLARNATEENVDWFTEGTVITYLAESGEMKGNFITHRIEKGVYYDEQIGAYAVQTRGDKAGAALDPPVRLSAIQAVVTGRSAFLSWFFGVFRNGAGFALLIALPLVVLLVCLVIRLIAIIRAPAQVEAKAETGATSSASDNEALQSRIEELKKQAIEEYLRQNPTSEEEQKE